MREDRRRRYDDGFRREALELIKSGAGKDTLASRLAIPVYTARNWIRLYRSNGEEAVMGGGGSRRCDWETKVAAARDHVENGLTKTEAMARHGIASIASLERWCRDYRSGGAQAEARTDARAGARRTGRVPGKTPGPAGVQVTRRERSAIVRLLAGRGHRLDHLLRIAGLPKSTYYHHLSRPAHVSRPDVEPMVREIWDGSTSTNGGGRSSNASASAIP